MLYLMDIYVAQPKGFLDRIMVTQSDSDAFQQNVCLPQKKGLIKASSKMHVTEKRVHWKK